MSAVSLSSAGPALGTQNATIKALTTSGTSLAAPSGGADAATATVASITASAPVAMVPAASGDSRFLHVTQYPSSLQTVDATY